MKQTRRSRRATRQRKRILMIGGVVLAAILIVFLGVYLVLRHSVNKVEKDTICNGCYWYDPQEFNKIISADFINSSYAFL